MENSFEIIINIMGDPEDKTALVNKLSGNEEYEITMPDGEQQLSMKKKGENWVQTSGTPLDSNTIHSITEALNKLQHHLGLSR
jgi:hypothetical protein